MHTSRTTLPDPDPLSRVTSRWHFCLSTCLSRHAWKLDIGDENRNRDMFTKNIDFFLRSTWFSVIPTSLLHLPSPLHPSIYPPFPTRAFYFRCFAITEVLFEAYCITPRNDRSSFLERTPLKVPATISNDNHRIDPRTLHVFVYLCLCLPVRCTFILSESSYMFPGHVQRFSIPGQRRSSYANSAYKKLSMHVFIYGPWKTILRPVLDARNLRNCWTGEYLADRWADFSSRNTWRNLEGWKPKSNPLSTIFHSLHNLQRYLHHYTPFHLGSWLYFKNLFSLNQPCQRQHLLDIHAFIRNLNVQKATECT